MAHIPPSAAIFSPSIARLATSAANDWNSVDNWLLSKFHSRSPAPFERNAETLKTLVALVAFNESVDEDRDAVISAEAPLLQFLIKDTNIKVDAIKTTDTAVTDNARTSSAAVAVHVLAAVEDALPREGHMALGSLTSISVELGNTYPEPADLGRGVMELQARLFQLQLAASSNDALQSHVEADNSSATSSLGELYHEQFRPPADLARLNLEMQRRIKVGAERLQDTRERTRGSAMPPNVAIPLLQENERTYVDLLAHSRNLDKKIKAFRGLPPDEYLARRRLEDLRVELQMATQERDNVFEGLVDKTSPEDNRA